MHAFDIMAEAKMRQWEKDVREGRTTFSRSRNQSTINSYESLEKILYNDIRATIIKAYMENGNVRKEMLNDADKMQVQLTSRLEKCGYHLMSRMFTDEIQVLKARASAVSHDTNQLVSLLDELG